MDRHPDRKIRTGKAVDGQRIRQANNNTIGTNQIDVTTHLNGKGTALYYLC